MITTQHIVSLDEAEQTLVTQLREKPWFFTVGIDEKNQQLFLYVKEMAPDAVAITEWKGFPVQVRRMNPVVDLTSGLA